MHTNSAANNHVNMALNIFHALHHADGAGRHRSWSHLSDRSTSQGDREFHGFLPRLWLYSILLLLWLCGSPRAMPVAHLALMQASVEQEDRCEARQIDRRCCKRKVFQG